MCNVVNMQDYKINRVFTSLINKKRCKIELNIEEREILEEMLKDWEIEELYKDAVWE